MKRRLSFAAAGILVLSLLLAGCQGNGQTSGTTQESSSAESQEISSQDPVTSETVQEPEAETEVSPQAEVQAEAPDGGETEENDNSQEETAERKMTVQVGDAVFTAVLEDNEAADALADMMEKEPVVIQMRDYSGFEKVGSLGTGLSADDVQTTTQPGDIVLYTGNQIVMFYGSNSWSYTRLGKIQDLTGWEEALGSGDVTVTLSLEA